MGIATSKSYHINLAAIFKLIKFLWVIFKMQQKHKKIHLIIKSFIEQEQGTSIDAENYFI